MEFRRLNVNHTCRPKLKLETSVTKTIPELLNTRHFVGRVEWIGTAPEKGAPQEVKQSVELVGGAGIVGEHHFRENSPSKRQVTLIQHEHFPVVAALMGRDNVDPGDLRRNIVVSGINLASLHSQTFSIGEAVLQGTGDCVPCSLMEKTVGIGGYAAMVGHGGITCVVVEGGKVAIGDSVEAKH